MKVAYLRTSTEDQTPENQLNDVKSLCDELDEVLIEKQSAFKDKDRPIFDSVVARIKSGEIKEVYVWDWDRLFRNRLKLKEFFSLCKIYKCQIHSFRQAFFEDFYKIPAPFDEIIQELVLSLMGWLAEDESKKKSERVKIAFKNHKGKKWGRPKTHTNKKKIVWEYRDSGLSIRKIAELTKLSVGKVSEICSEKDSKKTPTNTPQKTDVQKGKHLVGSNDKMNGGAK